MRLITHLRLELRLMNQVNFILHHVSLYKHRNFVLGAFAKLRKATVRFVMLVRPSVRMEQLGFHWTDFHI
jgi:hypothetical protein